jgi:hypothetical protein
MRKKITYIIISILVLNNFSCKNEKKNKALILGLETILKTNSIAVFNYSKREIKNSEQLEESIFRNLEVDTTKLFGTWTQDPTAPFADFRLSAKSFNVVDFESDSDIPYKLDKNEITVFYKDKSHKGIITLTENDTLKIKWANNNTETEYVKF